MVGIKWTEGVSPTKKALLEKEYVRLKKENKEDELINWFITGEIDVVEIYDEVIEFKGFAPRINGVIVSLKGTYLFPNVEEAFIEAFHYILAKKEKLKPNQEQIENTEITQER